MENEQYFIPIDDSEENKIKYLSYIGVPYDILKCIVCCFICGGKDNK
jgi:hypothetical protein